MSYVVVFFCGEDESTEVIVRFVDIGGIDDHHCLKFLFMISYMHIHFVIELINTEINHFKV